MKILLAVLFAAAIHPAAITYDVKLPERARAFFSSSGIVVTWANGVEVRNPKDGTLRWRHELSSDSRFERPVVVTHDGVIVTDDESIVAYAMDTGALAWRQKVGSTRHLSAGPHLIVSVVRNRITTILRLDPTTGEILAQRFSRQTESMVEIGDVVLCVQLPNDSDGDGGYVVIAYSPEDLRELWRFRQTGAAEFVTYDNHAYFEVLSSLFPIDLKTGVHGPKLPATGPVDSIWGGSTRQLETTDDRDDISTVRRNDVETGRPVWTVEVPFDVLNTLVDGDTLYVFGGVGQERDPHYIATIDWRDGELKRVSGPTPFVFEPGKIGDTIVATTWDNRLVCLRP